MTANATRWCRSERAAKDTGGASMYSRAVLISCRSPEQSVPSELSLRSPEQTGGPHQQHDRHDHEDHGVGRLGIEDLREPFDQPKDEAGHDRSEDGPHATNDHHGEDDDDEVGAHQGIDLVDGGSEDAGE